MKKERNKQIRTKRIYISQYDFIENKISSTRNDLYV